MLSVTSLGGRDNDGFGRALSDFLNKTTGDCDKWSH